MFEVKKWFLYCCIVCLLTALVPAAALADSPSPANIIDRMGVGINMGNTLEAPNYEGEWATEAREYYFDDYKAAGFKHVRIPIRWDKHTQTTYPYTIDSAFLDHVEQIVDWSLSRGLVTVINAHHETWVMDDYDNKIERLESIWRQVAERFKGKSENLLFEVLNEPVGNITDSQINDMNARILSIIRATNPTRQVIIGAGFYNNWRATIYNLKLPKDPNLIATFHYYEPYQFTHEMTGTWGTEENMAEVRKAFDAVKAWSERNQIPVYLGEYGARVENDRSSRLTWYDYVSDLAARSGFAFAVWDDEGWFKVYDRNNRTFDQDIVQKIMNPGPFSWPSPTPVPAPSPTPEPVYSQGEKSVEDFEEPLQWRTYQGGGASATATQTEGRNGKGMQVDFTGSSSGYWGVVRDLNADWSSWLKLSFDVKAENVNSFNVVLTEKAADQVSDGENWKYTIRPSASWTTMVIPFADFTKRIDYQPPGEDGNAVLNLNNIKNIQFLQNNSSSGTFTVDNIKLIGLPAISLKYRAADTKASDNHIKPHLDIENKGPDSVSLSDLTIRYWYTADGDKEQALHCDYALVGCSRIKGSFGSDYVEIGFQPEAGTIAPGGQSGEIQLRFNKTDWSNYDETNDYSYDGTKKSYSEWNRITVYHKGVLVWGKEPEGRTPIDKKQLK